MSNGVKKDKAAIVTDIFEQPYDDLMTAFRKDKLNQFEGDCVYLNGKI